MGIKVAAACGHRKAKLMEEGRRNVLNLLRERRNPADRYVWFHAASLGEFEQGRPLMELLRREHPEYKILLTFFSPSGYEVRKNYAGADIICYLPYDCPSAVRRFVDIVRPEQVFFVKYEFWGNCLEELHRRGIPVYLISGIFRQRQAFFKPYGGVLRPALSCFTHLFVQDEESRRLLASIGVERVTVCGDTRFDRVLDINRAAKVLPWAEKFGEGCGCVLVAGSTWPKDEDIILAHFNAHPEMKLIIASHEIHEERIQQIISKLKRPYMRYTQMDESRLSEVDCLIVDAIGFLSSIYRYGQVAYVGGGFGVGIHNTLEAAVYGMPVVFGPNHQAFREALGLLAAGGAATIATAEEYDAVMSRWMTDADALRSAGEKAGEYVQQNAGATPVIYAAVFGK
jgi:3-deoxy-D-manno-octulosonic-acid transferase